MNAELRGRKGLERSRDFQIWKVLEGGGALRGLKRLTYDSVVYFYFRYPLLVTSGYERNRSGACHGSLGRSNRVTFYPKKESLSKK